MYITSKFQVSRCTTFYVSLYIYLYLNKTCKTKLGTLSYLLYYQLSGSESPVNPVSHSSPITQTFHTTRPTTLIFNVITIYKTFKAVNLKLQTDITNCLHVYKSNLNYGIYFIHNTFKIFTNLMHVFQFLLLSII